MGGFGPHAGELAEVRTGRVLVQVLEKLEIDAAAFGADLPQDRLDARRLDPTEAAHADVPLDFLDWRVGHLVPRAEPPPELAVSGGAVGGTRVLRQDRVHQHAHALAPDSRTPRTIGQSQQLEEPAERSLVRTCHRMGGL